MMQSTARLAIADRHKQDALRTLRVLRGRTAAKAGCMAFQVAQDLEDPTVLTIIERWATRDDLDAHIRSSDYKLLLAVIELAVRPPRNPFRHPGTSRWSGCRVGESIRATGAR